MQSEGLTQGMGFVAIMHTCKSGFVTISFNINDMIIDLPRSGPILRNYSEFASGRTINHVLSFMTSLTFLGRHIHF